MAQGDLTIFDEAKAWEGDGTLDYDTNTFKLALLDNTTAPTAGTATPTLSDFTEVGTAGNYTAGGVTVSVTWNEAAGTVTFDSTTNPSWVADASNDVDAYWAVVYQDGTHNAVNDACVFFIELAGPVDMSANDLTLTFHATGAFTKT